ncbi:hypothetical protein [Oceanospirillum maris]|uniref:hypothetical protein n=1 Tax=Oceanospirillum maris TaxID=64977 RepID=UPI00047F1D84|nr:hypothetical protein [Oceanospirillum maris]
MMQLRFKDQGNSLLLEVSIKRIAKKATKRMMSLLILLLGLSIFSKSYAQLPPLMLSSQKQTLNLDLAQCRDLVRQAINASDQAPSTSSASPWVIRYQLLQPYKMACYHHAEFLSFMGAAELYTGRLADAQDTLERTLMLNPNHGQALIDYAQVLNAVGQPLAAYDLNQQLLKRRDLPEKVQTYLEQREEAWSKQFKRTDFRLSAALGYDSNLNTAADLNQLTLTDGLNTTLVLGESNKPISGQVLNLSAGVKHAQLHKKSISYWQANLYTRTGIEDRLRKSDLRHDQQQLDLLYKNVITAPKMKASSSAGPHIAWGLAAKQFWYNSSSLYQSIELQLESRRLINDQCYTDLELQFSRQYYPQDHSQEAMEYRFQPSVQCRLLPNVQLYTQGGIGFSNALNQRVGGDRKLADLLVSMQYIEGTRLWSLNTRYSITQDQKGYSPLLDNNNARKVSNTQFSGQVRQQITSSLDAELSLQRSAQRSNIELFDYNATRVNLGIDWRF